MNQKKINNHIIFRMLTNEKRNSTGTIWYLMATFLSTGQLIRKVI